MQFIQLSYGINIFPQCLAEVKLSCKTGCTAKADISHWNNCKVSLSTTRISLSQCAEVHRRVNDPILNDPCRVHPLLQENSTKSRNLPELYGKIGRERRGAGGTQRFSGYRPSNRLKNSTIFCYSAINIEHKEYIKCEKREILHVLCIYI